MIHTLGEIMRIGFISPDHLRDWHGTTRLIDRIAGNLSERGHEIVLFALEGSASSNIPVSSRPYPHELITFHWNNAEGRSKVRDKMAMSKLDICVASLNNDSIMYMPSIFKDLNIPFVYGDPHDPLVRTYRNWQPYESFGALACADAIQTLLPEYIEYYPKVLQPRVRAIGIPAPQPQNIDLSPRNNKETYTIIAVGRFNEQLKRYSLLLRAFALLSKDFPHWRLKMVGDGQFWEYYHIMVQQLGIKNKVKFTGAVADPDEHYRTADIFCLPSWTEGFPLVIAEAAAYALPIVGYRTCRALDVLIEDDMGALAESDYRVDQPESLAETLRSLMILSSEERKQMGIIARDKIQAMYGEAIVFNAWEQLIMDTIDRYKLGEQWKGLEPDSPIWTEEVLQVASNEIAEREDPFTIPEKILLQCELAKSKQEYKSLEEKYNTLLGQYQLLAARKGKRR